MGRKKDNKYDDCYQLYLDGLSLSQVAKAIGVTRQCIFKAFKQRGFMLRGINFRPSQTYAGLKFTLRNTGYYSLSKNSRGLMHRFVWESEIGEIPQGYDIHHINGQKWDNRIENLECLSKSDHARLYASGNNQYTKKQCN